MRKGKGEVVRPAGVAGEEHRVQLPRFELCLQLCQRTHRQPVILRQCGDEAVAAVRSEPDRIARKQILPVDEIDHVAPGVAGNEEALDADAVDLKGLAVVQQGLLIADGDLRQLVEMIDHLAAHLARQIAVLGLADIQLRLPEQAEAVRFDRADVFIALFG